MLALKYMLATIGLATTFVGTPVSASPIAADSHDIVTHIERANTINVYGDLTKRAPGPSGQLLQPVGEQWIYTEVSWPGFGFHFVYKPAYVKWTNPSIDCKTRRDACYAATRWVEVSLVSNSDPSRSYKLADYLHVNSNNPSANIDTWLGVPKDAVCGDFRVKVVEHQRYFNEWVSFQSAAPLVHMQCLRYAGPSGP